MSLVIVTQYTTVFPMDTVEATGAPTVSSTLSILFSTTAESSSAGLSSIMPTSTSILSSILTSFTITTPNSSATATPHASDVPKPKFNDTFAYIILAVVIVLAVLLMAMLSYLILLCCRGQCPKCRDMQLQLNKWESGQLKRITKDMVQKREPRNKNKPPTSSVASSDDDIEMGIYCDCNSAHTLEGNTKPSIWRKAKAKVTGRSPPRARTPSPSAPPADIDRFFTVDVEDVPDPSGTYCVPSQPPQVRYNPGDNHDLYASPSPPRHSSYSSSLYSQPGNSNRASRTFGDQTDSSYQPRGPLKKETDESKSYTAFSKSDSPESYNSHPQQLRERLARERLETAEYKEAEAILNRVSADSEKMRRALSIVNPADQQVNMVRHPSYFTEVDGRGVERPPAVEEPVFDFRRDRDQAPVPVDVPVDYTSYLASERSLVFKP